MNHRPSTAKPAKPAIRTPPSTVTDIADTRMRRELQRLGLIQEAERLAAQFPHDLVLPDFALPGLEMFIRTGRL
jgi:hypothetical protein